MADFYIFTAINSIYSNVVIFCEHLKILQVRILSKGNLCMTCVQLSTLLDFGM